MVEHGWYEWGWVMSFQRRVTVAQLFHTKEHLMDNNSGDRDASQNPKWRRPGNKSENS